MAKCPRCNKPTTALTRSLFSGLCPECRKVDAEKAREKRAEEQRQFEQELEEKRAEELRQLEVPQHKRVWRLTHGREEPEFGPLNGLVLIGTAVAIALVSWAMIGSGDLTSARLGIVGLAVAGMIYLAGVIRWAVSGAQMVHLDRLQRQNYEIIELLELIADKKNCSVELDSIRELRSSGQLAEDEFRKQRRALLRS